MKEKSEFKQFVNANKVLPEFTITSVIIGILLAILFGAANAYLGLRVGMTVSASIPAAVISMGIIRIILKRDSILENNIVQTIGSAGESVASGAIFTLPALFMWAKEWNGESPSLLKIALITFCGAVLGILFMIPLRKALIVKEHGVLPYPEGTACAEVLIAGEHGGSKSSIVFSGMGISAIYKFIADGLKIFPSEIHYEINAYGTGLGLDVLPALVSVGYICGYKVSSLIFSGGLISWLVIIPIIKLFGDNNTAMFPADVPINMMDSFGIWTNYLRYIGAGAVAAGGIISLIKSLPLIIETFVKTLKNYNKNVVKNNLRTEKDMSMKLVLGIIIAVIIFMDISPIIPVNFISSVIIVVFGFFFATVSARLVGVIGSSNNPVSGMAIATLIISSLILKVSGTTGSNGMIGAIVIGSIICIIAAISGDTSQDLKTGYILGATPKLQQYGELIGAAVSSLTIGGVLYLLSAAWGYGSSELPAPQAMLMKMVVEGVMNENLPWNLVLIGVFIAIVIEVLGIPVLPFTVGIYLPVHLSATVVIGGIIKAWFENMKGIDDKKREAIIEKGVLYSSGMIAGEGIIGILLAVCAIIPMGNSLSIGNYIDLSNTVLSFGNAGSWVFFTLLILSFLGFSVWHRDKETSK